MVPNSANIAKTHCFPLILPTLLEIIFNTKILTFFEIPVVGIEKGIPKL